MPGYYIVHTCPIDNACAGFAPDGAGSGLRLLCLRPLSGCSGWKRHALRQESKSRRAASLARGDVGQPNAGQLPLPLCTCLPTVTPTGLLPPLRLQFLAPTTTLPEDCPLSRTADRFWWQEAAKEAQAQGLWRCRLCGKQFISEEHLDRHLGSRHADLEMHNVG
jgi:hypothetical protein